MIYLGKNDLSMTRVTNDAAQHAPLESEQHAREVFDELREYVGFTDVDAAHLQRLAPLVEPYLPDVSRAFYEALLNHPGARAVLTEGAQQAQRLRGKLEDWLRSIFSGPYDAGYVQQRYQIGRVHVAIKLPQHYMFAAMEVIRQELKKAVASECAEACEAAQESLNKILALDLAVILESYQGNYAENVRQRERSVVQERLTQAEHLAQIGQLAASLAHEIKNPLAGISGAIQVIRDTLPTDAPHRPILGEVLRQINRLDQTVKDLLVYARPMPPRFNRCHLDRLIERVMTLLAREPEMQRVRFEHEIDPRPLPTIEADGNQIEQLAMNLILNAAHASPDDSLVSVRTKPNPKGVLLEIEDRGQGMDQETARHALDPFFTTKSKGTGLGLPICRRIAESHGGTLTIHTETNHGTTVSVQLPYRQDATEPSSA